MLLLEISGEPCNDSSVMDSRLNDKVWLDLSSRFFTNVSDLGGQLIFHLTVTAIKMQVF